MPPLVPHARSSSSRLHPVRSRPIVKRTYGARKSMSASTAPSSCVLQLFLPLKSLPLRSQAIDLAPPLRTLRPIDERFSVPATVASPRSTELRLGRRARRGVLVSCPTGDVRRGVLQRRTNGQDAQVDAAYLA